MEEALVDLQSLTVYLSKLKKMTVKMQAELLKPYDISNRHATYIVALYNGDGMTMKELSDSLCVDPANTTRVIATLTEKGYVQNDCKKKGCRKFKVFLTDKGKELADHIRENIACGKALLTSALTEEESRQFMTLLVKLAKGCADKYE